MGCYAALPALRMARQFCLAQPEAVVLIVCLELCSLHMQMQTTNDSILGNALFSDGAAAALVSAQKPAADQLALALDGFMSAMVPEGRNEMAWEIGNRGFNLELSSYVPNVISAHLGLIVDDLLLPRGLAPEEIDLWAIHPGGRAILDKFESSMALRPSQIEASRAILRDFGNMSSATILFVLQRMLEQSATSATSIAAMAFGPGLTVECGLLRVVPKREPAPVIVDEPSLALAVS
jgi:predicted naringenin-chalcone synthase